MSTRNFEISFRCLDDCIMQGCPYHKLIGEYQRTSDWITIKDENNNIIFSGDKNKAEALEKVIKKLLTETIFGEEFEI